MAAVEPRTSGHRRLAGSLDPSEPTCSSYPKSSWALASSSASYHFAPPLLDPSASPPAAAAAGVGAGAGAGADGENAAVPKLAGAGDASASASQPAADNQQVALYLNPFPVRLVGGVKTELTLLRDL